MKPTPDDMTIPFFDGMLLLADAKKHAKNDEQRRFLDAIVFDNADECLDILEDSCHSDLLGGEFGARALIIWAYVADRDMLRLLGGYGYNKNTNPKPIGGVGVWPSEHFDWSLEKYVFSFCPAERLEELLNIKWTSASAQNLLLAVARNSDEVIKLLLQKDEFRSEAMLVSSMEKMMRWYDQKQPEFRRRISFLLDAFFGVRSTFEQKIERASENNLSAELCQFFLKHDLLATKQTYLSKKNFACIIRTKNDNLMAGASGLVSSSDLLGQFKKIQSRLKSSDRETFSLVWSQVCKGLRNERPDILKSIPEEYRFKTLTEDYFSRNKQKREKAELWFSLFSLDKNTATLKRKL